MDHPSYAVWWSPEDNAYLATETGRPAGTVHGSTPQDALREAIEVAEEWNDAAFPGLDDQQPWASDRIRALRRSLSLSQREFARMLNVSLATVRAWEQGQRVPAGPATRLLDLVNAAPGLAQRWQADVIPHIAIS